MFVRSLCMNMRGWSRALTMLGIITWLAGGDAADLIEQRTQLVMKVRAVRRGDMWPDAIDFVRDKYRDVAGAGVGQPVARTQCDALQPMVDIVTGQHCFHRAVLACRRHSR